MAKNAYKLNGGILKFIFHNFLFFKIYLPKYTLLRSTIQLVYIQVTSVKDLPANVNGTVIISNSASMIIQPKT